MEWLAETLCVLSIWHAEQAPRRRGRISVRGQDVSGGRHT